MKKQWFFGELVWKEREQRRRSFRIFSSAFLVRASNPEDAYDKFFEIGASHAAWINEDNSRANCSFCGLSGFVPVYDKFIDGAELAELWSEVVHESKIAGSISSIVQSRKHLITEIWRIELLRIQHGCEPMFSKSTSLP